MQDDRYRTYQQMQQKSLRCMKASFYYSELKHSRKRRGMKMESKGKIINFMSIGDKEINEIMKHAGKESFWPSPGPRIFLIAHDGRWSRRRQRRQVQIQIST